MTILHPAFLWGAATAPHQTEGNNVNSDFWANEARMPGMEPSADAVDSYHRYPEDMRLLADAGLTAYRFGIEWSRIEPRPGQFSRAALAHYRRMIDTALDLGLTPVVTLQHFTAPRWFAEEGGWTTPAAVGRFRSYVEVASTILNRVPYVCTINEPNMLAMMATMFRAMESGAATEWQSPTVDGMEDRAQPLMPAPDPAVGRLLVQAHGAAREVLKERTDAAVGWTIANQAFYASAENQARLQEEQHVREDFYLEAARGDDFVGVQSYSTQEVGANGPVPHEPSPHNTIVGTPIRPEALGVAVRHTWEVTGGVPILITENGIATADDSQRIAYTKDALRGLYAAIDDGVDVRGYLHWSLLDNYEWGHWEPTFGLVAVNRKTFERAAKPSLAWLGGVARVNGDLDATDNHSPVAVTGPHNPAHPSL